MADLTLRIQHPDGILGEPFTSIFIGPPPRHVQLGTRPEVSSQANEEQLASLRVLLLEAHPVIKAMNEISVVTEAMVEWACWMRLKLRGASSSLVELQLSLDNLVQELVFFLENHVAESWACPHFLADDGGRVTMIIGKWSMADIVSLLFGEDLEAKVRSVLMAHLVSGEGTVPVFNGHRAAFPLVPDAHVANVWHFNWGAHQRPLLTPPGV